MRTYGLGSGAGFQFSQVGGRAQLAQLSVENSICLNPQEASRIRAEVRYYMPSAPKIATRDGRALTLRGSQSAMPDLLCLDPAHLHPELLPVLSNDLAPAPEFPANSH